MSQESRDRPEQMRPEYDIRGGVRGKYYERYVQATTPKIVVTFEQSALVFTSTASAPAVGSISKAAAYQPAYPSPKIQGVTAA